MTINLGKYTFSFRQQTTGDHSSVKKRKGKLFILLLRFCRADTISCFRCRLSLSTTLAVSDELLLCGFDNARISAAANEREKNKRERSTYVGSLTKDEHGWFIPPNAIIIIFTNYSLLHRENIISFWPTTTTSISGHKRIKSVFATMPPPCWVCVAPPLMIGLITIEPSFWQQKAQPGKGESPIPFSRAPSQPPPTC